MNTKWWLLYLILLNLILQVWTGLQYWPPVVTSRGQGWGQGILAQSDPMSWRWVGLGCSCTGRSHVGGAEPGLEGPCIVRSNASWEMITGLTPVNRQTRLKILPSHNFNWQVAKMNVNLEVKRSHKTELIVDLMSVVFRSMSCANSISSAPI